MRGSVRNWLLGAFALAASAPALAGSGYYLPPAPVGPGGEDSIETASGTRCRQSINGNGAYLDVGVAGNRSTGNTDTTTFSGPFDHGNSTEALGYARMIVPLGHKPQRLDCSRIYEMEIQRMQREIELLKMAAE